MVSWRLTCSSGHRSVRFECGFQDSGTLARHVTTGHRQWSHAVALYGNRECLRLIHCGMQAEALKVRLAAMTGCGRSQHNRTWPASTMHDFKDRAVGHAHTEVCERQVSTTDARLCFTPPTNRRQLVSVSASQYNVSKTGRGKNVKTKKNAHSDTDHPGAHALHREAQGRRQDHRQ